MSSPSLPQSKLWKVHVEMELYVMSETEPDHCALRELVEEEIRDCGVDICSTLYAEEVKESTFIDADDLDIIPRGDNPDEITPRQYKQLLSETNRE